MAFWGTPEPAADAAALGLDLHAGLHAGLDAGLDAATGSGTGARLPTLLPHDGSLVGVDVPALLVPVGDAVRALTALTSPTDSEAPGSKTPAQPPDRSVHAWAVAARLALEHVTAGHLVPALHPDGEGRPYWRAELGGDPRLTALAEALPAAAHALRTPADPTDPAAEERIKVWSPLALLTAFCDAVADACARAASADHPLTWDTTPAQLADWARAGGGERAGARLCLRLGLPAGPDALWPLTFHLEPVDEPGTLVSAHRVWQSEPGALSVGGRVLDGPREALLQGLTRAARVFRPLAACLEKSPGKNPKESQPTRILLTPFRAAELFGDAATALRTAGIGLVLPRELDNGGNVLTPRLRVGTRRSGPRKNGAHSRTVTYRWEAVVGAEVMTTDEVALLAARGEPLARWRDTWIRLDHERIDELAALVSRAGRLSTAEALSVALCGRHRTEEFGDVPAVADGSVADLVARLREAGGPGEEPDLTGVRAELRDYQRRGVAWLRSLTGLGFGALLADDMGLGKTLQTIALLAGRTGDRPRLVVCPTSVVSNWERELARFAPGLTVLRHHGPRRATDAAEFTPGAVVITSYALLRLDADLLTSVDWDLVVLDEAQQIKNPTARTARAALRLRAGARVALTGTPVENRLSELWSLAHFTNPGLLGPHARFKERFAVPIERDGDQEAAERLRAIVSPFLLRRLKSTVAGELPAKMESTVPCDLTDEQARLYRAAVTEAFDDGDGDGLGTGIRRQGNVLRLLTHLKQICNHPAQFLGEDEGGTGTLAGRSGKLARATEMLGEAVAAGDRALVFTQYRVMGQLLSRHLAAELGLDSVPFLHGGTPAEQRDAMVDAFQHADTASPLLVISLKAGGFGLNLTRASHVLHYDRWWNPAVEDQATDRAHRIGQTRTVHVHKLVTADTFEERVDALLESKRSLADAVVGTGETWLAELDDDALRTLVRLADDAEGETV
ncbi:DEAD/DEAH box helicase [Streptomyces sp. I05A-00742]|uniref:DEAD/DEAH box helicase n=1 Tax=Streptomyces sp. I05A-00742 TaxID=2732853 RepID=UPI001BB25374|nr:DEAD/DEAH box helicase [Streptomyces sp. I05A-00742]